MTKRTLYSAGLSLLVVTLIAVDLVGAARDGSVQATFGQNGPCEPRVDAVGPSAHAAGLRAGDAVQTRAMSPAQRAAMSEGLEGERATLIVRRAGSDYTVHPPYVRVPPSTFDVVFAGAGIVVYLLTGAFVLWRGRDDASLGLGTFLMCFAASAFNFEKDGFLSLGARSAADVGQFGVSALDIYGAFVLNESLARNILAPRTLRVLRWVVVAYATLFFVGTSGSAVLFPLTGCVLPGFEYYLFVYLAGAIGIMAILGAALIRSRFADRRLSWIFWTTIVCFVPYIVLRSASRLLGVELLGDPLARALVEGVPFLALPIVYAYVILRYRLLDISFVLNRALAYTILTTLLLGGVILAENFAEKVALSRNASLLLELTVPLALGLSFDALQKRLQNGIDRLLFAAKHRAVAALLRFAHECGFIEKPELLRQRTVETVSEHTNASAVALYERAETSYRLARASGPAAFVGDVDADDPAFVRMRATLGPTELEGLKSALGADGLGLPLAVGGTLEGMLLCGPRRDDEAYGPDERDVLQRVAQSVGAALASSRARERAAFVAAVAEGQIGLDEAVARARDLRAGT